MNRRHVGALAAFVAAWCAILWGVHDPGTFNVDEVQYLLAAKRFAEHGDFLLPNGYAQFRSNLLLFLHPGNLAALPSQAESTFFVPPYYPMAMAAAYGLLGLPGMFAATLACHAFCLAAMAVLSGRLLDDEAEARQARWIAFGLATGGAYFADYAIAIINHMASLALLLGAALTHPLLRRRNEQSLLPSCVACGLLAGIACGVRSQSVVTAAALGVFLLVPHRFAPLRLAAWLAGFAPPIAGLSLVNLARFDDPFPFSYGTTAQWSAMPLGRVLIGHGPALALAAVAGVAILLALWSRTARLWEGAGETARRRAASVALGAGLAACGLVLLAPPFARQTLDRFVGVWVWPLAGEWRDTLLACFHVGPRAAWLQTFPVGLAALAASFGIARSLPEGRSPAVVLLAAIVAGNLAFVCALPGNGGYFFNQRYLIDAAAFAIVLAAVGGAVLAPRLARRDLLVGGAVAVVLAAAVFAVPAMKESEALLPLLAERGLLPAVAVALAVGAALAFSPRGRRAAAGARIVAAIGPCCLVLPLLLHARVAMAETREYRATRREAYEKLLAIVPDGSLLVVHGGQREPAGRLKEFRDVWVADAQRTGWKEVPELLAAARDGGLREHFFVAPASAPPETLAVIAERWRGEVVMEKPFPLLRLVPVGP